LLPSIVFFSVMVNCIILHYSLKYDGRVFTCVSCIWHVYQRTAVLSDVIQLRRNF
jgi:hypothetical protein